MQSRLQSVLVRSSSHWSARHDDGAFALPDGKRFKVTGVEVANR